ncbi:MAG TPA: hypothetical protein VFD70_22350 [Anaerolineae bacterium]|nr:hypothetical protein [Anaerolineae bacterium]
MAKTGTLIVFSLIGAAIVYQVVTRVSQDALNVALGVMCGIGASIPVSVGLMIAMTRQRQQAQAEYEWRDEEPTPAHLLSDPMPQRIPQPAPQQPQVIVIAPPQSQFAGGQFPQGLNLGTMSWSNGQFPYIEGNQAMEERNWRIIGEE